MVANNFTVKETTKNGRTSGSSGTERSGSVFEPRQGAEASHVQRAATSIGESEGGLATHGAYSRTKAVEMEADPMNDRTISRCKGEMVC